MFVVILAPALQKGLDYLSSPTGVIKQAQDLAAAAYGADRTWFLVNGCSIGIHAAVMSTCGPGQTLLIARNCHLSAFSACVLAGCSTVWLQPQEDHTFGIPHCVTPETLQHALLHAQAQGLNVGAVLVVSPTYFGVAGKIKGQLALVLHVSLSCNCCWCRCRCACTA